MRKYLTGPKIYAPIILKIILNKINHLIARKNLANHTQLLIYSFDHIGLKINLEGRYDKFLLLLIEKFISEKLVNSQNEVMLDIGANIGNHSVFFSNFFKKVYAFEPNDFTYQALKINAEYASKIKNIKTFNYGLSEKKGTVPFLINQKNLGGSKIIPHSLIHSDTIWIPVKPIDDVKDIEKENISLIKIDTEGHEFNVLKGAEKTILSNKPAILFEQSPEQIQNGSSQTIDYLRGFRYKFYQVQKSFYFGESTILILIQHLLSSIMRHQYSFVEVDKFKKKIMI